MINKFICSALVLTAHFAAEENQNVLGLGFCPLDQLIQVSDAFIKEVTAKERGSSLCTPETIDTVIAKAGLIPKLVPGGSAANTIRALSNLGQSCAFLGPIGNDESGEVFRKNLQELGVELRFKKAPFTSRVLCLIAQDGQRSFLACDPQITDLKPSIEDVLGIQWIHLEARSLTMNQDYIEKLMQMVHGLGLKFSIDLSSYTIVEQFKESLLELIKNAEIVFCNEDEIETLTGMNPEEGCLKLQEMSRIGVVTLGEKGCLVGSQGSVMKIPAFSAKVVDTTGAGDYFAAGFLYGYLHQKPLEECGRIGNRLGNAIIEVIGAELPKEYWSKIFQELSIQEE